MQEEFEIKNNVLVKYHEQKGKTEVVIPDGVTEIGKGAFYDCYTLTKIKLPESVVIISEDAFKECLNLKDINIPNRVKEIGSFAFTRCKSLTSITIPDSVERICEYCFCKCINLRDIKFPDKLTHICAGVFKRCTSLSEVKLPESVTYIGYQAFTECTNLEKINIPKNVNDIETLAFWYCEKLSDVTIPNSVKKIGYGIFDSCVNLKNINISSFEIFLLLSQDLKAIALNTIIKNKQQFSEEEINKFKEYIKVTRIKLLHYILKNDNLLDLLNYMLNNMDTIYTREEVDSILKEVTDLNEISNKTEITEMLLEYKNINFGFENPLNEFDLGEFNEEEINLQVMQKEFEIKDNVLIRYHEQEGKTEVVIPDGVTEIGNSAFINCYKLENVIIPDSVTEIDDYAFWACTNLTKITLPESVTNIKYQAFANCENLVEINIPNNVTTIEKLAFLNCKKLVNITLPNNITEIRNSAFDDKFVKSINVPSYTVFSNFLDFKLKVITLNTIIKNKEQFSEEEINKFKKFMIERKMYIIEYVLKNDNLLDLLNYMLNDMGRIYTRKEVDSILKEVTTLDEISNKTQITGMLFKYKKRNFGFENPLDEFDLGEFNEAEVNLNNGEDENEKGRLI